MGSVVAQDTPDVPAPELLGPVSPELVLVDPVLAEVARRHLPPPREPIRAAPLPPRRPPRRLRRTLALAAVIFTAGAAWGQFSGDRSSTSPDRRAAPSPKTEKPPVKSTPRPATRRTWAANVLGVTTGVSRQAVNLVWKTPSRSDHVVVIRRRDPGVGSVVVFRGRAARYRDATARSCSEYRYTIVNYDRRGRRSTGVLTSVVTPGCA